MTKEILYEELCVKGSSTGVWNSDFIKQVLNDFFDSNVVIPKGEQPHDQAELLHQYLENTNIVFQSRQQVSAQYKTCDEDDVWNNISGYEYRIKPQEPVYEWQWYWIDKKSCRAMLCKRGAYDFATEEEAEMFICKPVYKIEETKRVRQ